MKKQASQPGQQTDGHNAAQTRAKDDSEFDDLLHKTLCDMRQPAPAWFADRVMNRIADSPSRIRTVHRTIFWQRLAPAAVGAAAAVLVMLGLRAVQVPTAVPRAAAADVQFVFYAPGAEQVELIGDFTDWQPGRILLEGPDAAGRWTARIALPEGRHEYIFLVDGRTWQTDPLAQIQRPDGFGNLNAVMNL